MADKEFLERMLSMLPEEFQDVYDDTIPEAKEIRKKIGKKVSSVKSYSCAMPMFEDIRKLNYKGQAQVCKTFPQNDRERSIPMWYPSFSIVLRKPIPESI